MVEGGGKGKGVSVGGGGLIPCVGTSNLPLWAAIHFLKSRPRVLTGVPLSTHYKSWVAKCLPVWSASPPSFFHL